MQEKKCTVGHCIDQPGETKLTNMVDDGTLLFKKQFIASL